MQAVLKISRDSNDFITHSTKNKVQLGTLNRHDTVWTGIKRHIH